jgi:hypothetical protein
VLPTTHSGSNGRNLLRAAYKDKPGFVFNVRM